jgi:hypothetical protein
MVQSYFTSPLEEFGKWERVIAMGVGKTGQLTIT